MMKNYFEAEEWRTLIKWCTLKNHNSQSTMTCQVYSKSRYSVKVIDMCTFIISIDYLHNRKWSTCSWVIWLVWNLLPPHIQTVPPQNTASGGKRSVLSPSCYLLSVKRSQIKLYYVTSGFYSFNSLINLSTHNMQFMLRFSDTKLTIKIRCTDECKQ